MFRRLLKGSITLPSLGMYCILKIILPFAIFSLIVITAKSQSFIKDFESLSINEGLPHSSVYSIIQDKRGFMWFGTADGLCRYDGTELKPFRCAPSVLHENVLNIVRGNITEDKSGNIWYSNETGIYRWDQKKEIVECIRIFSPDEFKNVAFESICFDNGNTLWLLNLELGIFEYNIVSGRLNKYPFPANATNESIYYKYYTIDGVGNIWLKAGSFNNSFIVFNMKSGKYTTYSTEKPPLVIIFDHDIRILAYHTKLVFETSEGVISRIANINSAILADEFNPCSGLRDRHNRLWLATRGSGLVCYEEKDEHIHVFRAEFTNKESLPSDLLTSLYIDRDDNLWIGTDGGGVSRLDLKQPRFNLFPACNNKNYALSNYFTKCFFEDESGRIWFGTHSNGLNIYNPRNHEMKSFLNEQGKTHSLAGNIVGSIFKDVDGNIWIGSSGGIAVFNEKKGYFNTIPINDLPPLKPSIVSFVSKIVQLKNGILLAATSLGIIVIKKDKTGNFRGYYAKNHPFLTTSTADIIEMPSGAVYSAFRGNGLNLFRQEGDILVFVHKKLSGYDLLSLRTDEKKPDFLWIGTNKGLIHFDTKTDKYQLWNEDNGLPNNHVYGSLEDTKGNLWISSNKGLSYFDRQKNEFFNYTYQDGLQSNEFNSQAFYKSKTGIFYFGGVNGFNWFGSDKHPGQEQKGPSTALTSITINEQPVEPVSDFYQDQSLVVPYTKNDFSFRFAVLDYTHPESNKIKFLLSGWDNNWIESASFNIRYSNLPPGKYSLRCMGSNTAGNWGDEIRLDIVINAPFWQRSWFLFTVSFLLLTILIIITTRIARMKSKKKLILLEKQVAIDAERARISADMHDEIGSGITQIALLCELMQMQDKNGKELKHDIQSIAASARDLVRAMSEIVWAMNPQNDTLESLLAYIREQSVKYFEPFDLAFSISFTGKIPDLRLNNTQRRNLYLVTRESLNNALKHAKATKISLVVESGLKAICFTVSDNGKGLPANVPRPGNNGITNMKRRMQEIGGTIEWMSDKTGTTVTFCIFL